MHVARQPIMLSRRNMIILLLHYYGNSSYDTQVKMGRGCSSVGRASDRHAAEAGSIPCCGKGLFFPGSTFSTLFYCGRSSSCALTSVGTFNFPSTGTHTCFIFYFLGTKISHAVIGKGRAAPTAVVALPR